jgi:hypothetical protein
MQHILLEDAEFLILKLFFPEIILIYILEIQNKCAYYHRYAEFLN